MLLTPLTTRLDTCVFTLRIQFAFWLGSSDRLYLGVIPELVYSKFLVSYCLQAIGASYRQWAWVHSITLVIYAFGSSLRWEGCIIPWVDMAWLKERMDIIRVEYGRTWLGMKI
jgi:hypothetical protein